MIIIKKKKKHRHTNTRKKSLKSICNIIPNWIHNRENNRNAEDELESLSSVSPSIPWTTRLQVGTGGSWRGSGVQTRKRRLPLGRAMGTACARAGGEQHGSPGLAVHSSGGQVEGAMRDCGKEQNWVWIL